jgi:ABC-type nitrate/sulfonate/bicarbonate transport system ATPase subunit
MPAKISLQNISKSFSSNGATLPVVNNISLEVETGKFLAIIGPSGCGKSTLMKILTGFEHPDSGQVTIDGRPHDRPDPNGVLISQHGSVFPWMTVRQNLMFGLGGDDHGRNAELADHYAELVGLKGFEKAYPNELSGGMLKRVEIARALVVKPEILYMDEPFSALDALTNLKMRKELLRILEEERHTVVLITHDVEEAIHLADRIIVLSKRPTGIQATFDVPFAHPRKVSSPEAQKLKEAILRELGL